MTDPTVEQLRADLDPESDLARLMFDESPQATIDCIESFFTIPNELGKVVKMKFYPQQKMMMFDETGRDVTVKGRQTRASSVKIARRVRRLAFQLYGARCLIGAQDDATTALFRAQVRHHVEDLQAKGFGIKLKLDNEDEMVFEGSENRIQFVSGEQRVMGRAFAAQEVHLSELAHWKESALTLIGGLMPSVPAAPYGRVDFESTPAGEEGAFYKYAMDARPLNPHSLWTVHFYPWWLEPRYRLSDDLNSGCDILLPRSEVKELHESFSPAPEEADLMEKYGLEVAQILWRRLKKAEQDKTDAPFVQEYPEDLEACWIGTTGRYFDTADGENHLAYYRQNVREPFKYLEKLSFNGDEISFYGPNLAIWEMPHAGDAYVVWMDCAGGGIGADYDYTSIGVWNATKEKRVARLRLQCTPKHAGAMACAVGAFYGTAMLGAERDARGAVALEEARDLGYPNIYYYVDPMNPLKKGDTAKPGLPATPNMREKVLEKFKYGITTHAAQSMDAMLVREMNTFTWQKAQNRMRAAAIDKKGAHDDVVMEAAGGWYVCDVARMRRQAVRRRQEERDLVVGRGGLVIERVDPRTMKHAWFI